MSGLQLRGGTFGERGSHPKEMVPGIEIPSIMVSLSEPPESTARWRIRLEVKTETTRKSLGSVLTVAPASGSDSNRIVALATVPGAIGWFVEGRLEPGTGNENSEAILEMASSPCCGSLGLVALPGASEILNIVTLFSDVAGPNPLIIPAGTKVTTFTARAGLTGGLVTLNPGIIIGIEASDSFSIDPQKLIGPLTMTFSAGILRWVVETIRY